MRCHTNVLKEVVKIVGGVSAWYLLKLPIEFHQSINLLVFIHEVWGLGKNIFPNKYFFKLLKRTYCLESVGHQIYQPFRKMTPFMAQSESHLKFSRNLKTSSCHLHSCFHGNRLQIRKKKKKWIGLGAFK